MDVIGKGRDVMKDYLRIAGKTAIVTGSAQSIGFGIARALASYGVKVMLCDIDDEKGQKSLQLIRDEGGTAEYCHMDIFQIADVKRVVAETVRLFGGVDILVNNAGITRDGLLMKMSEEDFDAVLNTNLKGAFNCMRHVARQMVKQRGGRIINISSVSGVMGNAGQVNYAASKSGIIGMTMSLAREVGSRGITVNAVAPGFIQTAMTDVLSDEIKEQMKSQIPLGTFGSVQDIANAVVFLASDEAKYITGQTLHVDGGMAM